MANKCSVHGLTTSEMVYNDAPSSEEQTTFPPVGYRDVAGSVTVGIDTD